MTEPGRATSLSETPDAAADESRPPRADLRDAIGWILLQVRLVVCHRLGAAVVNG